MKLLIKLVIQCLKLIYILIKPMPTKNKITFISRQHDTCNVDFVCLIKEIHSLYPEYECKVLAKTIPNGLMHKIGYGFHILVQMYHIATSKVVVLDTYCIPVSILNHKKSLVVIQIWHAVGAMKKFGYSVIGKAEGSSQGIANLMCMHKNYSYICTSSAYCIPYFAEAFHVSIDKVIVYPLPRLDQLLNKQFQEMQKQEIQVKHYKLLGQNKKTILYVPTFRKDNHDMSEPIQEIINELDFETYNLIVSVHPLSYHQIHDDRVILQSSYDSYELLSVADIVITDYSAILYEAALLKKALIFYLYDYKAYAEKRSFYMNLEEELPGPICFTAKDLIEQLVELPNNTQLINDFCTKYVAQPIENYTNDLVEFIVSQCKLN